MIKRIIFFNIILISLTSACTNEKKIFTGPFLIIDGVKYDQKSNSPVTGVIENYHDSGALKLRTHYRDGLKNGSEEWFYENGQLRIRSTFHNGKQQGKYEIFFTTGQLSLITNYTDGKEHGVQVSYSNDGAIISRISFKQDKAYGFEEYFYNSGELKERYLIIDNFIQDYKRLSPHGKIIMKGQYLDNFKHGIFSTYHIDGDPRATWKCDLGRYVEGSYINAAEKVTEDDVKTSHFNEKNPSPIKLFGDTIYLCSTYNYHGTLKKDS